MIMYYIIRFLGFRNFVWKWVAKQSESFPVISREFLQFVIKWMLWECGQNTRELSIGYFRECHTSLGEICSSFSRLIEK